MLQIGTDAGFGQRGPHRILVHGIGMLRPHREIVGISREICLQVLHHFLVFKKQHRAGSGFKHGQLLRGGLEFIGRHNGAQRIFRDLPQLFMLRAKQHHHAGGLRVERRGRVQHGMLDDFGHFGSGQRQVFI